MISFFRRLRNGHIGKGSWAKYLLYAVGEILLVVVGILIALQVNNWNESRSQQRQESIYLQLIYDDLVLQKEENEVQRRITSQVASYAEFLMEGIDTRFQGNESEKDRFKTMLSSIPIGRTYGAYESTFLDLTSSGKLSLISNIALKNQIIRHFQIQQRDRNVINNNTQSSLKELWSKLLDRNMIMIPANLKDGLMGLDQINFDAGADFLEEPLFEALQKKENLLLLHSVLGFKISMAEISLQYLDDSDARIHRLTDAIAAELGDG